MSYAYVTYGESSVSRSLVLAAIPIILTLATLAGGISFFAGSGLAKTLHSRPRQATLPVASDHYLLFASREGAGAAVAARTAGASRTLAPVSTDAPGNWVRIPAIGVRVPLVTAASQQDADIVAALSHGVALYPNGIRPGQPGNVFISGHSTGIPLQGIYRFAFIHLKKLQPDDTILVDHEGFRYTYRVVGSRTIDPRAVPALDPTGDTPTLTLMSCWPLWTTQNRLLQHAELVAVNPLTVRAQGTTGT